MGASPSSCYTEVMGLYLATAEVIWLRNLLSECGFPQDGATAVEQDNQATMLILQRGEGWGGASKMFAGKYFWITEMIQTKQVRLEYKSTLEIVADGFTKAMKTVTAFSAWANRILGTED